MKIIAKCDKCNREINISDMIITYREEETIKVNTDCVCRKCDDCSLVKKLQKEVEELKSRHLGLIDKIKQLT